MSPHGPLARTQRPGLLPGLAVLALAGAAAAMAVALAHGGFGATAGDPAPPIAVTVGPVTTEPSYTVTRSFVGRVEGRRSAAVGFELTGTVVEVAVDEGARVAEGDALASLDTARLEAERARLEAERSDAVTRAGFLARQYERRAGAGSPAFSDAAVDEARSARDQALAQIERIDAQLRRVAVDLEKASLRAPFDAVVIERTLDEGQVVGPGATALILLEDAAPEARIGLAGPLRRAVAAGQRHTVVVDGRDIPARVIAVVPSRDPASRTIDAILRLETDWRTVDAGDLARLSLPESVWTEGAWVPLSALTESARGLFAAYVAVPAEDADRRAERYEVEVLHQTAERAFVRGLPDGASVVTAGVHKLVPGLPVRLGEPGSADAGADAGAER
jgi:RND family efflux transporter MFP subunit